MALDAKVAIDDNALFRHADLRGLRDFTVRDESDPMELEAQHHQINYIRMQGDIGVLVNGAGLALATLDMLCDAGGRPANFMDIRTTASSLDIASGFQLILENPAVRAILVNVHGGGMQACDTIAEGIGIAVRHCPGMGRDLPIVISMAGNSRRLRPHRAAEHRSSLYRRRLGLGRRAEGCRLRQEGATLMAILVGRETRVVCQGMTGRAATFHVGRMLEYGTRIVGGVTPGKGGTRHFDLPVFNTVAEAVRETGADASLVFVPPPRAGEAMIEAIHAGIPLIVCVTERVPLLDMVRVRQALDGTRTRLVGPNSQGVLAPKIAQLGVMSTASAAMGTVGIASRSASLTSEIVAQVTRAGLGESTTVGVGGDPVHGLTLAECVELFMADDETKGIILIGEIGGSDEEQAAAAIAGACARTSRSWRWWRDGTLRSCAGWVMPVRSPPSVQVRRRRRSTRCGLPACGSHPTRGRSGR